MNRRNFFKTGGLVGLGAAFGLQVLPKVGPSPVLNFHDIKDPGHLHRIADPGHTHWLPCDGRALSRDHYRALFDAIAA